MMTLDGWENKECTQPILSRLMQLTWTKWRQSLKRWKIMKQLWRPPNILLHPSPRWTPTPASSRSPITGQSRRYRGVSRPRHLPCSDPSTQLLPCSDPFTQLLPCSDPSTQLLPCSDPSTQFLPYFDPSTQLLPCLVSPFSLLFLPFDPATVPEFTQPSFPHPLNGFVVFFVFKFCHFILFVNNFTKCSTIILPQVTQLRNSMLVSCQL